MMSSWANTRRRQTTSLFIVHCAFAEDCRCSKTGYMKKGFMENHLERVHPGALGLTVSAPYCLACDVPFGSKRLLIDHIIETHVRTRISSFPARAASGRSLPAALDLPIHEATVDRALESGETRNMPGMSLYNSTMIDQEDYVDVVEQGRVLGNGAFTLWTADPPTSAVPHFNVTTTFPYIPQDNTLIYVHPEAQQYLPQTPVVLNPQVDFQGRANQHHEGDQPERLHHS